MQAPILRQAFGFDGNDTITSPKTIPNPTVMLGGAGDDKLTSQGPGNAILVGGDGNDQLAVSGARDLLIGGNGKDKLAAGAGDDLLIGGRTVYDSDLIALGALMKEWSSANSYGDRIDHLLGNTPGGFNASTLIRPGIEVFDDALVDTLAGGAGQDLFFALVSGTSKDQITDLIAGEVKIAL